MEVAGLAMGAVGLLSLFNTCVDVIERIESYRNFQTESGRAIAMLNADKVLFYRWAEAVGIAEHKIKVEHHPYLDHPEIASATAGILSRIHDIFAQTKHIKMDQQKSLSYDESQDLSAIRDVHKIKPTAIKHSPPTGLKGGIKWALGGKTRFIDQVHAFGNLVEKLYRLVPPGTAQDHALPGGVHGNESIGEPLWFSEIQKSLDEIVDQMRYDTKTDIRHWLGAVTTEDLYQTHLASRLNGTCLWICTSTAYVSWVSLDPSMNRARLLWMYGPAGCGKSVLCATLVESLQNSFDEPVASFFCSSETHEPTVIIRSWIWQLTHSNDNVFNTVCERMYSSREEYMSLFNTWDLFEAVCHSVPHCTLIADGLDECLRSHATKGKVDVSKFFARLKKSIAGTSIRILLLSRDEGGIRAGMHENSDVSEIMELYQHEIRQEDLRPDIQLFSQQVVEERLPKKDKALKTEIATQMSEKCEGMFLWIKLQGSSLRSGKNKKQLQSSIRDMPKGLSHTYDQYWEIIQNLPAQDKERAISIIRWATFALRPLTVLEMTELLVVKDEDSCVDLELDEFPEAIDEDYVNGEILGFCGSLLEIQSTSQDQSLGNRIIRLAHFSIKEFFISKFSTLGPSASLDSGHNILAKLCLRYLNYDQVWIRDESTDNELLEHPFLDYASKFWFQHIVTTSSNYSDLLNFMSQFFKPGNPHWLSWREKYESEQQQQQQSDTATPGDQTFGNRAYYAALLGIIDILEHLRVAGFQEWDEVGGRYGTALQAACAKRHASSVQALLRFGADPNIKAGEFGYAVNAAVASDDEKSTRLLLQAETNVQGQDSELRTPLFWASTNGNLPLVQLLLQHGVDIESPKLNGVTPLYTAAGLGHTAILTLLLEHGANPKASAKDGSTPINAAAFDGHNEVVKLLLDRRVDPNVPTSNGRTPLYSAALNGHAATVTLLLENGALIDIPNGEGWTAVNAASYNGHEEVTKVLLDHGADWKISTNSNITAQYGAARNGHVKILKMLLDRGADVTVSTSDGWTPIIGSSYYGHIEVVRLLFEYGIDPKVLAGSGWIPINAAAWNGHVKVVELLLDHGVDASSSNNKEWNPVCAAAYKGHVEVVKLLLDRGANLDPVTEDGWTPLIAAAFSGNIKIVELLLDRGIDVTSTGKDGWTSLHTAAMKGSLEVALLLLDQGADLKLANTYGWTPLHMAANSGKVEMVKSLLDRGADIGAVINDGWSNIHVAAHSGHLEVVKLLLDLGADVTATKTDGWAAIHIAASNGHLEVVKLLLDRGTDVTATTTDDWSAIHIAAYYGHPKVAKLLLDKGAVLTATNNGWSAIHVAAHSGHLEVVKLLLDLGADVAATTTDGSTAIHTAAYYGHVEVLKLLISHGANPSAADQNENTALIGAVLRSDVGVARVLLDAGVDIDATEKSKWTALNTAAACNDLDMTQLLLDRGASVVITNIGGATPLHSAARRGNHGIVETLLKHAPSNVVSACTHLSETPLHFACKTNSTETIRLLASHGADPLLRDGYGFTCGDWASSFPPCLDALGVEPMSFVSTPRDISNLVLQATMQKLIRDIRVEPGDFPWNTLGQCLLVLGKTESATVAFETAVEKTEAGFSHSVFCYLCKIPTGLTGELRFVCRDCADINLCLDCFNGLREASADFRCKTHEFIKVSTENSVDSDSSDELPERVQNMLAELETWLDGVGVGDQTSDQT